MRLVSEKDYLEHHGILGQKWGVRRYQYADGSLTAAGKKRYKKQLDKTLKKEEWKSASERYYRSKNRREVKERFDKDFENLPAKKRLDKAYEDWQNVVGKVSSDEELEKESEYHDAEFELWAGEGAKLFAEYARDYGRATLRDLGEPESRDLIDAAEEYFKDKGRFMGIPSTFSAPEKGPSMEGLDDAVSEMSNRVADMTLKSSSSGDSPMPFSKGNDKPTRIVSSEVSKKVKDALSRGTSPDLVYLDIMSGIDYDGGAIDKTALLDEIERQYRQLQHN